MKVKDLVGGPTWGIGHCYFTANDSRFYNETEYGARQLFSTFCSSLFGVCMKNDSIYGHHMFYENLNRFRFARIFFVHPIEAIRRRVVVNDRHEIMRSTHRHRHTEHANSKMDKRNRIFLMENRVSFSTNEFARNPTHSLTHFQSICSMSILTDVFEFN